MKLKLRPVLFLSIFVFLLMLAGYPRFSSVVLGQSVPQAGLTVVKDHLQNSSTSFKFEVQPVSNGIKYKFNLKDGQSQSLIVPGGTYIISEGKKGSNTLVSVVCNFDGNGTVPGTTANLSSQSVVVTLPASTATTCTFTNSAAARIDVRKYNDANGNGTRSSNEKYLKNWVFTVFETVGNTVVAGPKKTNSSGAVKFDSLAPGTYKVCETLQSGWTNTQPGGAACYTFTLGAGQTASLLFGNFKSGGGGGGDDDDLTGATQTDEEGIYTNDADMEVNSALIDGIEIVDNPDVEYGPEWDDALDATLVHSIFMPVVRR